MRSKSDSMPSGRLMVHAHWWTTIVNGSAAVGERLCFRFTGLDEQIVMRVDAVHRPKAVSWSCIRTPGATSGKERNCTFGSLSAGQRHVSWTSNTSAFPPRRRKGMGSLPGQPGRVCGARILQFVRGMRPELGPHCCRSLQDIRSQRRTTRDRPAPILGDGDGDGGAGDRGHRRLTLDHLGSPSSKSAGVTGLSYECG